MGQAKQRGTFDQRQSVAYDVIDKRDAARAENLKALEEMEKVSEAQRSTAVTQGIVRYWEQTSLQRRLPAAFVGSFAPECFSEEVVVMAGKELAKLLVDDLAATEVTA